MRKILSLVALTGVLCIQGMAEPPYHQKVNPSQSQPAPTAKKNTTSPNKSDKTKTPQDEDGVSKSKRARDNRYGEFGQH